MGRLLRLPLTVFDRTGVVGHQSLARDHLAYCDLATDRQKRANDIVRAHHALTVSRVNRGNSTLADALRPAPNRCGWSSMGVQFFLYHPPGREGEHRRQGTQGQLALNWAGPYEILAVGLCSAAETPDGSPLGSNLHYLDLPSDMPGSDARRRVAIKRCKPCANPHDSGDMPKYLPAGLTQYVVNIFSKKFPPYHVTQDDVSIPLQQVQRMEVEQITGDQSIRGRVGVIAVQYKTHWAELCELSWEREMDLHLSRSHILRYWAGTPDQHRQTNRLYRQMRIGAAQRELSRNNGKRLLAPDYACVPRADWLRRYHDTVLPKGAHFWFKEDDGLWWLEKISASTTEDKVYLVRILDDPGPTKLSLPPACCTTSTGAVRVSWCLQVHIASAFSRGIQRKIDESRGAVVASWLPSRHRSIVLFFFGVMRFESLSLGCS